MRLRKDAKIELIRGVPLFARCTKKELAEVASLADELDLDEGATLIREGTRGREFFALVSGTVEVRRKGRKLQTMSEGFFGEIALVLDVPRTATVTAVTPVRVLVLTGRSFDRLLEDVPSLPLKVMRALAERVAPQIA